MSVLLALNLVSESEGRLAQQHPTCPLVLNL